MVCLDLTICVALFGFGFVSCSVCVYFMGCGHY